jgi:hypothetical protein
MTISTRRILDWFADQTRNSLVSWRRLSLLVVMGLPVYVIARWGYQAADDTIAVLFAGALGAVALNVAASLLLESRTSNETVPWIVSFVLGIIIAVASNRVLTELRPELTKIILQNMNRQLHVRFELRHVDGEIYVSVVGEKNAFPAKAEQKREGWEADVFIGEAGKRCDFVYDLEVFEVRGDAIAKMATLMKDRNVHTGVPATSLPTRRLVTVPIKVQKNDCAPTSAAMIPVRMPVSGLD